MFAKHIELLFVMSENQFNAPSNPNYDIHANQKWP